ncbi:MaoC family dehydratase [Natronomonas sp.]|uniref:MaoC family dehydratase n=1 Tax=Natronomonas sp. TaxID=2184060 RepID=UPI002615C1BC|nr:MaoC family dehydratase [Natronomonas sp.]
MNDSRYSTPLDAWANASSRVFSSLLEANQAANRAAFSVLGSPAPAGTDTDAPNPTGGAADGRLEGGSDLPGWDVERDVGSEVDVGDSVRFSKTLAEEDVQRFAAASGDTNPIHLDDEWAEGTRFNGRIVHGILVTGLISAALARLPGSIVYLSQDIEFRAPVRVGDCVTATVEIAEDLGGDQYRIRTTVAKGDDQVIDGEAIVLVDDAPEAETE